MSLPIWEFASLRVAEVILAILTSRLLPSAADLVFFLPKCDSCASTGGTVEPASPLEELDLKLRVWCWFFGSEVKVHVVRSGKLLLERQVVVSLLEGKQGWQTLFTEIAVCVNASQFSEGSDRRKISFLSALGTWVCTEGMLESQGWTRDEKEVAKEIAGPSFSFL